MTARALLVSFLIGLGAIWLVQQSMRTPPTGRALQAPGPREATPPIAPSAAPPVLSEAQGPTSERTAPSSHQTSPGDEASDPPASAGESPEQGPEPARDTSTMTMGELILERTTLQRRFGQLAMPAVMELLDAGRCEVIADLQPGVPVETRDVVSDMERLVWTGVDPRRNQFLRVEIPPEEYPELTRVHRRLEELSGELNDRKRRIYRHPDQVDAEGRPLR